jgi:hypothetical protein
VGGKEAKMGQKWVRIKYKRGYKGMMVTRSADVERNSAVEFIRPHFLVRDPVLPEFVPVVGGDDDIRLRQHAYSCCRFSSA